MADRITIALAGNPNSGKTTIFNRLTGERQHVGNYPGVTVEKKEGLCTHDGVEINVVDLPGTYSLTAYSVEELVSRDFIIHERPDVVVDIVDASNLERNLYLAVQFMELRTPLILAFNMSDVARTRGIDFDLERLSGLLGAPIVSTVGHRGRGIQELLDEVLHVSGRAERRVPRQVQYGREIEEEIARIEELIASAGDVDGEYDARWLAIKLLENDPQVRKVVRSEVVLRQAADSSHHLETIFGEAPEIVIAGRRYGFISGACQEAVRSTVEARHTVSDKIDTVLTSPLVGIPIFLLLMYGVFHLTFTVGVVPMGWLESFFGWLAGAIAGLWPAGSESVLKSLLVDGIVGGVGGVVSFLPNILLLFLAIAFLEDSGYMARAAFLMDRLMHKIGLHGKSFIPMLIGFGCSVPGILATRTLESRRDRLVTMLVLPLMSCGARLTIYALIIPAFFPPHWRAPMLWVIYLIGIVLAIASVKLLRATIFRGEAPVFVMELPLYRLPTLHGLLVHMWDRAWMYLRKAGTIILAGSVIMWALTTFPRKTAFDRDYAAEADAVGARAADRAADLNAALGLGAETPVAAWLYRYESQSADPPPGDANDVARAVLAAAGAPEAGPHADKLRVMVTMTWLLRATRGHDGGRADRERAKGIPLLAASDPNAYAAAVEYLDRVKAPADRRLAELRHARHAEEMAYTVAGRVGRAIEPALEPLGFDWRIGTALIGALPAKELFVAQMGIVFAVGADEETSDALRSRLQAAYTPLQAFCIMLFCLISAPCIATIAVTWKESESWRWAAFQLAGLTVLAYLVTLIAYQVGRWLL